MSSSETKPIAVATRIADVVQAGRVWREARRTIGEPGWTLDQLARAELGILDALRALDDACPSRPASPIDYLAAVPLLVGE